MPRATITIKRHGSYRDDIDADVWANFAIHEYVAAWQWKMQGETQWRDPLYSWTVTHIPTGWACLHTRTKRAALAARREFVGCGLDWSFTDPAAMSLEAKRAGREIKSRYEGK